MEYLDFDLHIGPGDKGKYPITVKSPAGEASEEMLVVLNDSYFESTYWSLLLDVQKMREFGQVLFDALLVGGVRDLYNESRREAELSSKGLRLRLHIQPPELMTLPWELLYNPRQPGYLCLSRKTPIVRYLDVSHPPRPLPVTPPLRILGMAASPSDLPTLDMEQGKRHLERALEDLQRKRLVELAWIEGQTWQDLQRAMRNGPWHVFHFFGHSEFDPDTNEGRIFLAENNGRPYPMSASELGELLVDEDSLRLVVLNSCEGARGNKQDVFSSIAGVLVRLGVPASLAMQCAIREVVAIEVARSFYEALTDGMPVDAGVTEIRKAIRLEMRDTVEWVAPVLYMRAPNGTLFDLQTYETPLGLENLIDQLEEWKRVHHALHEVFEATTNFSAWLALVQRQFASGTGSDREVLELQQAWGNCYPKLVHSSEVIRDLRLTKHDAVADYESVSEIGGELTNLFYQPMGRDVLAHVNSCCVDLRTRILPLFWIADQRILDLTQQIRNVWKISRVE